MAYNREALNAERVHQVKRIPGESLGTPIAECGRGKEASFTESP